MDDHAIEETLRLLKAPDEVKSMTDSNYQIAQQYFSLEVLEQKLKEILANF